MKFHPPAGECLPRAYILGNELAPRGKQIDHGIVHLYAAFWFQIKITQFPADYCPRLSGKKIFVASPGNITGMAALLKKIPLTCNKTPLSVV
jgi:hypothetical protein